MLLDPLNLSTQGFADISTGYATSPVAMHVVDPGAILGKTVRKGQIDVFPTTMTISHSETKESKPYGTKRVNVRFDFVKNDSDPAITPAQGFVQVTFGQPKALVTSANMHLMFRHLARVILYGDAVDGSAIPSDGETLLGRILNGEG